MAKEITTTLKISQTKIIRFLEMKKYPCGAIVPFYALDRIPYKGLVASEYNPLRAGLKVV